VEYQWDPIKAESNNKKHGIDFEDAVRGNDIRLISARPATKVERKIYEKRRI
jgi:uncharacterized DUF497 family protein